MKKAKFSINLRGYRRLIFLLTSPIFITSILSYPQTHTVARETTVDCSGTLPLNVASCYGATGDFTIINSGCNITSGSTLLTCSSAPFKSSDVGKYVAVQGAGASTSLSLSTTITSYVSSTQVNLSNSAGMASTGTVGYGTDNTSSLQNAYSYLRSTGGGELYFPRGAYLHHGLNFTNSTISFSGQGVNATELFAIAVTNPGRVNSGTTVGVDLSGTSSNTMKGLVLFGSYSFWPDLAPTVNVLMGRTGTSGTSLSIDHLFMDDTFQTWGAYNVFNYQFEQTDYLDDVFQSNGSGCSICISSANSFGIVSPYQTLLSPTVTPPSTTKINFSGGKTVFAGNIPVFFDDGGYPNAIYNISFRDAYVNLYGNGTAVFSDNSTLPTYGLRHIVLDAINIEAPFCANCYAAKIISPAWNWRINNVQFYHAAPGTVSPFVFSGGYLDGEMIIDANGAGANPEVSSPSCWGSVLHLGQQGGIPSCTDYALASSVNQAFSSPAIQLYALGSAASPSWWKIGTFVGTASYPSGPQITVANGPGYNSGSSQQSITTIFMRMGNGTAAPNVSGLAYYTQGAAGVLGVKAVATGGSTSGSNESWDIYLQIPGFSAGGYSVALPVGGSWTPANASANDPGPMSSTVVVGTAINLPTIGSPQAGQAACIKSAGPPVVIGYCLSQVTTVGGCTCN